MSLSESIVVALLGMLIALCLAALLRRPAAQPPLRESAASVQEWERRFATMPQHTDLRSMSDRLFMVEKVVDVVRAEMGGLKDGMARVERSVDMLMRQQLESEK